MLAALDASDKELFRPLSALGISEILTVRSPAVNFWLGSPESASCQWSAKHGPGIRKAHSPFVAHPGRRPQETSRPRDARSAVPVRRAFAAGALARGPESADRRLYQRGRKGPQTWQPHL